VLPLVVPVYVYAAAALARLAGAARRGKAATLVLVAAAAWLALCVTATLTWKTPPAARGAAVPRIERSVHAAHRVHGRAPASPLGPDSADSLHDGSKVAVERFRRSVHAQSPRPCVLGRPQCEMVHLFDRGARGPLRRATPHPACPGALHKEL
jgi:hypothetical protein